MKMKKIIYFILIFVILIGCISCKENNIDLEDIYYNKLPVYEKQIIDSMSILGEGKGRTKIQEYEFTLLDKSNPEDVNSILYKKSENMLGKYFTKAIVLSDKTNNVDYTFAIQYKNSFVAYRMGNRKLDGGTAQYRYKNVLMSYFCYSYFMLDDYKEIDGCFVNKNENIILGGNNIENLLCLEKIDYFASFAFFNNQKLESITLNDKFDIIFWYAFYGASNLKHVELNKNINRIKDYAFYNTSLEYIVIPEGVEEIGKKVFNCGNIFLEEYTRPEGWRYDFAVEEAEVYYKGQWEYNEEGIPVPLP